MAIKFRYMPHTADISFVAYGKDISEAVENAAIAMLNIMLDLKKIKKDKGKVRGIEIRETALKLEDLIWFTLQDILSRKDRDSLSAFEFKVNELKEDGKMELRGRLLYKELKANYALLDIKAVTPHDLEVKKGKTSFSIRVTVDI